MLGVVRPAISENLRREHGAADIAAHVDVVLSEPADVEDSVVRYPKSRRVAELLNLLPAFLHQIPAINHDDCFAGFAPELEQPQPTASGLKSCGF